VDLIVPKKEMFVRKSEALLNARYQLGELALKLISIIYSSVKRSDEVGKYYQLKVADIAQLLNKNYGEIYNLLDEATDEMLENPLKIVTGESEGKKEWVKFNWISDANYKDGVISFSIAPRLKPYILELQQKFVKYRLENILNLRGVYVIRFYEILKDIFNQETRHNKKAEKIYTLFEFREMLEIPKSYQYSSHIKKLILEKAKKQFAKNTDILFTYEEIKTGRKVTHIRFFIYKNPKNYKEDNTKNKKIEAPAGAEKETKLTNNWNDWRKELRHTRKVVSEC
jgi:plasmid replication initiation protein